MYKKRAFVFWFIITIISIFAVAWSILSPKNFQHFQSIARQAAIALGIFAPVLFVLLQALQVIITPISHYTVGIIGGYLYGPLLGGLLNYLGRIIGHICAFWLAKKYGRSLVKKWIDERTLYRYDHIFSGETSTRRFTMQHFLLLLVYFLPLFPDDEISYLVGLSNMSFFPFLLANLFGHVGGALSLSYIGSGIDTKDVLFWVLSMVTLVGFPIMVITTSIYLKRKSKSTAK